MLKYLKKYWHWCLIAPLFMIGEIAMDLIQPDMMADIVDNGVLGYNLSLILTVGGEMILLVIFGGFCGIMSGVFANLASQNFGNDLRKDLFGKIMNLSFQQTDKITTGSLVTRLTNDVNQVQNMVNMLVRGIVRNSAMFVGGVFMLYRQSPQFSVVAACAIPFILFFVIFFMKKASKMFVVVQKKLDGVNNVMQEDVAGARVIKAYVKEDYEMGRFDEANTGLYKTNLKVQYLLAFMSPCMNIVLNVCTVAVIFVGGINIQSGGTTTPGEIMAALTYLAQILNGITFMANIFQTFTRSKASWDRINEVLSCDPAVQDGSVTAESEKTGEVEFKNVSFSYPNGSGKSVLENISFKVKRGESLGIIGTTGSGKSSLVNLIPRFYDATEGEVLVDGENVKDYPLTDLRDKIAIVLQKTELYSRPIEANIRWGKPEADPFEIKTAAEIAQADEFICNTPDGYYTQVAESGHSLSGGQKQRISISRAILKNPEILIFDDSTSALDLKTEANLNRALRDNFPNTTKILIAQRIASIKDMNHIAVLEDGKMTAFGTHEELLKSSDSYLEIYNSQLNGGVSVAE
ncbi:MAG: ABC transporter ATP-binding protein/permease [Clostridiales bacterium]|nr:ABC transporter ATP-binding protein/permease [Clostridiales bacterium]